MSDELRMYHNAGELYLSALTSAWGRQWSQTPSVWLARDPDVESKMLRDPIIGHAVQHRCALVAAADWNLLPSDPDEEAAQAAVELTMDMLGNLRGFKGSKTLLARAFFHGARYGEIQGAYKIKRWVDNKPRRWWVPQRIVDQNQFRYRKVTKDARGPNPRVTWERWDLLGTEAGRWGTVSEDEAACIIGHIFDNSEETLGHGRGLREALGWPWYALSHVNQEAIGAIERFARGWIVAKVNGARHAKTDLPNDEVIDEWLTRLEQMQGRHVMVLQEGDDIETLNGSFTGWQMITQFQDRLKEMILTLVLSANLPTSASKGGSFALADVQESSTDALIQGDRESLDETLTDDLLGCLWYKNWSNLWDLGLTEHKPRFSTTKEHQASPKDFADTASVLNGMGVALSKAHVLEMTGNKMPDDDEELIPGRDLSMSLGVPGFGSAADLGGGAPAPRDPFGIGVPVDPGAPPSLN